jgi:hypothetical protein
MLTHDFPELSHPRPGVEKLHSAAEGTVVAKSALEAT